MRGVSLQAGTLDGCLFNYYIPGLTFHCCSWNISCQARVHAAMDIKLFMLREEEHMRNFYAHILIFVYCM